MEVPFAHGSYNFDARVERLNRRFQTHLDRCLPVQPWATYFAPKLQATSTMCLERSGRDSAERSGIGVLVRARWRQWQASRTRWRTPHACQPRRRKQPAHVDRLCLIAQDSFFVPTDIAAYGYDVEPFLFHREAISDIPRCQGRLNTQSTTFSFCCRLSHEVSHPHLSLRVKRIHVLFSSLEFDTKNKRDTRGTPVAHVPNTKDLPARCRVFLATYDVILQGKNYLAWTGENTRNASQRGFFDPGVGKQGCTYMIVTRLLPLS